jgi:hypothetical protein
MSNLTHFTNALGTTARQGRLALRLWATSLLFALLVVAPLAVAIQGQAAHSLAAGSLLARMDVDWLTDLSTRFQGAAPLVLGLLLAALLLYLLLAVFLNGGVIGGLLRPGARSSLAEFCHDCGLYFWRFLRLFLLSIPVYLLFVGALHGAVTGLLRAFTREAASEWPVVVANGLRLLALVLLLGIVSMFLDYVKIGLAAGNRRSVLKEAWRTLKLVGRRFLKAWGLYLLAGAAFAALALFYLEVARLLPKGTPLLLLAAFLWQQLFVLGRQFSKVLFFASEIELFKEIAPKKDS